MNNLHLIIFLSKIVVYFNDMQGKVTQLQY